MALVNKHKSTPNQSTQYLTLQETTGVFGTLNPGGYGALQTPAGIREITDILSSNYHILQYDGSITYSGYTLTAINDLYSTSYNNIDAQAIANGTTKSFDLATLIGVNYIDAVYKSIYYNWFDGSDVVNQGSTSGNLINVPDYTEFTNAKYISIDITGFGGFETYEIIAVNTNNTIQINESIILESDHSYKVAYESTAYFANTYNINKCLHTKISQLALSNCSCKNKSTEKLYEAVMMYMSIQPNMDLGKYTKAQEIIQALTLYCGDGSCNC